MKRPQPDLETIATGKYINSVGDNRKLKRLWGTAQVDGVEVLNSRRYYHKAHLKPDNADTLFRFLGVYKDLEGFDGEGLKSAWFTLNKSKGPEETVVNPSFVVDNLNLVWWDANDGTVPENLTLTTSIVIGRNFNAGEGLSSIDWKLPKADLIQNIVSTYESLWSTNEIKQEGVGVINKGSVLDPNLGVGVQDEDDLSPDDPWLSILARYALRSDGLPCTIKNVEVGLDTGNLSYRASSVYNTAVITLEIPYHKFTDLDPIVDRIVADISTENFPVTAAMQIRGRINRVTNPEVMSNEHGTQRTIKTPVFYETAEDVDASVVTRLYTDYETARLQPSIYENFWIKSGDTYYFRAEVISDPKKYGTTQHSLKAYLFSILDTGYKKKKVPIWKKIVAAVVFIVAVILAWPTGGASLSWAYAAAAAFAITMGALVLSVLAALSSSLGDSDWAGAFASVSKTVAPLVTVASIILIIDIVSTASKIISEQGLSAIADMVAKEVIGASVTELGAAEISARTVLNVTNKMVQAYTKVQSGKLSEINSRNKDLKAEYDKLSDEMQQETNAMAGFMNIYAKPATADWSIYASTYDMPYERGGGTMAMGNIQRTTKQAVRKADYKESVFEGVLLV